MTSGGAPSFFGHVPGIDVGRTFKSRADVRLAGLHRHEMNGISGNAAHGADAIVVNGGYVDDLDRGEYILYTGEGGQDRGRQVRDQTLTGGNLALERSAVSGLPVRVIRGYKGDPEFSPPSGYRYDGLYAVLRMYSEPSIQGPMIYRYELLRESGHDAEWTAAMTVGEVPVGTAHPGRATTTTQRIVRNSAVAQWVKDLYDNTCQFCGARLEVPTGAYSEGAHIRPLGGVHEGEDTPSNVLCLCANCHVRFDKGALYLDGIDVVDQANGARKPATLFVDHEIDVEAARYHYEHIARGVYERRS